VQVCDNRDFSDVFPRVNHRTQPKVEFPWKIARLVNLGDLRCCVAIVYSVEFHHFSNSLLPHLMFGGWPGTFNWLTILSTSTLIRSLSSSTAKWTKMIVSHLLR